MAALHLIRHRSSWDLERRQRGELVRGLLEGDVHPDASSLLGLDAGTAVVVVALRVQDHRDSSGSSAEIVVRTEREVGLVALYFESFQRHVAQVTIGQTIYIMIPESRDGDRVRLLRLIGDPMERLVAELQLRIFVDGRQGDGAVETFSHLESAATPATSGTRRRSTSPPTGKRSSAG